MKPFFMVHIEKEQNDLLNALINITELEKITNKSSEQQSVENFTNGMVIKGMFHIYVGNR